MCRWMAFLLACVITMIAPGCARQPNSSSVIAPSSSPSTRTPAPTPTLHATFGAATKRVVGLIPTNTIPELLPIHIHEPIRANQPLTVTVLTYGSSSCITPDGAAVSVAEHVITITPYDVLPVAGACTADFVEHPRIVTITFLEAGQATIRIQGQDFQSQPTAFETNVRVLP